MTPQRRAVLDAVVSCGNHPTAAEVYARVRELRPGIAYATVYNALHALVERGVVLQLNFGDGASRYDARTDRHDHALCLRCGTLADVAATPPPREALLAVEQTGFVVKGQHTQFFGLCAACRANRPTDGKKV